MKAKLLAYLDLIRLPNVFTAVADPFVGLMLSGADSTNVPMLVALATTSACLYAGGVVLNDICDAERDRRERPARPIPSGQIAVRAASILAALLLCAGIASAAFISFRHVLIAALLIVCILLYDGVLKSTWFGPPAMGLCRALNLSLGACTGPFTAVSVIAAGLMWLYVTSLTFFAREEAQGGGRKRLIVGTVGVCSATLTQGILCWLVPSPHAGGVVAAIVLAILLALRGFQAAAQPHPDRIQRAVKAFVLSLVAFDGCLTWIACGPASAAMVISLLAPALLAARLFRVT